MKLRLDQYLCQNGLVASRKRAKALIMAGVVFVDEQKVDKPGTPVHEDAHVEVRGHDIAYVSRGGLKLEKAMHVVSHLPCGTRCAWISALLPGGFTDCMLQNGAQKGVCRRRGLRAACLEAALRRTRGKPGAHEHPPCHARDAAGRYPVFQRGCVIHFVAAIYSRWHTPSTSGGGDRASAL